jgi:hypothetical protein
MFEGEVRGPPKESPVIRLSENILLATNGLAYCDVLSREKVL